MSIKTFEFVVFNPSGKKKLGMVRAWSLSEAKRKIQLKGFYLASIKIQDSSVESGASPTGSRIKREGSRGTSGSGVSPTGSGIKREGIQGTSGSEVEIKREGIQETSSHNQNSFSFFEGLKRFFFPNRVNV
jgi:hypothetical protein